MGLKELEQMGAENKVLAYIHETAVVSPGAKIGRNVEIGPYSVIGENVEIGEGTRIGPHVVLAGWTSIGKDCQIFQGASVGEVPQDLKFKGEKSYTFIGDRTVIREGVTIHRAAGEGEETRVGSDCLLMAMSHVAHNCILGNHVIIEDRVVIGGMAGIHQFVKIGRNAMVGGMAKLVQDVVPYTIVDGHPAKVVGLNSVGISRAGIPLEIRRSIKKAYKILYRSGLSLAEAISVIEQEVDSSEEVEHFLRFLRNAERGICRERRNND